MNGLTRSKKAEDAAADNLDDLVDPALRQTLLDFKASVDAWSDAELSRPRAVRTVVQRRHRLLVGWSLAAALLAATAATGGYEHHQSWLAQQAAAQRIEQERAAEKARIEAQQDEKLFASVDSAVSREVPSAMEPLAVLEDDSATK